MRARVQATAIVLNPKTAPFIAMSVVWELAGCIAALGVAGKILS